MYIFFRLKYFPDNYSPCRFWEKDREVWRYYYGSSYEPYQRARLRREVQRYDYLILLDDKAVCDLLCRGIGNIRMPKYFGELRPDSEFRDKIQNVLQSTSDTKLIIKPVTGSAGQGIALATKINDRVHVQVGSRLTELDEYQLEERSIIQEFVVQDDAIAQIAPASVNTIRVVTLLTTLGEAIPISASMRFGVGQSYVDNWSAGGIAVGVDHKSGTLKRVAYDKSGNQYAEHPISNISFEGFRLPFWREVLDMAINVQEACPFIKLLGMDIAISATGPILIELNPSTDLVFQEQTAGPLLRDERTREEFKKYNLLVNRYQKSIS